MERSLPSEDNRTQEEPLLAQLREHLIPTITDYVAVPIAKDDQ